MKLKHQVIAALAGLAVASAVTAALVFGQGGLRGDVLTADATSARAPARPAELPRGSENELALHPFSPHSPWNAPVPPDTRYAGADDARVRAFRSHSSRLNVEKDWYTQWVWYAKPDDPLVTINVSALNLDGNNDNPYWIKNARAGDVTLRMPPNAAPDPGTPIGIRVGWADSPENRDAHLTIIDPDGKTAHEFWHAEKDSKTGKLKAVAYARVPLDGLGVNIAGETTKKLTGNYYNPDFKTLGWGPARAYGGSSLGGLIRAGEITRGPMKHALALLLPFEMLGVAPDRIPRWPATRTEDHSAYAGQIVLGTRFAIPRSVDVERMGLQTPGARILARALQDFGAYVVDSANTINLNADGVAAQADGQALRDAPEDLKKIRAAMTIVDP